MHILCSLILLSSLPLAQAAEKASARVERLVGTALFNGKEIREGDNLAANGSLETRKRSLLRLRMDAWESAIVIGPDTKMALDLTSPKEASPKRYQLTDGFCRWISSMKSSQMKGSHVFTRTASLGIRGTDFEILNREATGETEVIVFDGEVLLKSNLADSEAALKKGQWGGVGGKFGPVIAKPKDLSPEDLKRAKERTESMASGVRSTREAPSDSY